MVSEEGNTIETRFLPAEGFCRSEVQDASFQNYLRELPLHPVGSKVHYFDGRVKENEVYEAVIQFDVGNRDLQQCADAIMRLRAEYFFANRLFDSINFNLTNGFNMNFAKWSEGWRVAVDGNSTKWIKVADQSDSYITFREYMEFVFTYAGTLSLSKQLKPVKIKSISIGDVFIVGGSPGHAVIVVDLIENALGEKRVLFAQSYMPAQEIQILKNFEDPVLSPWYKINDIEVLRTPEWTFAPEHLKTW
jgi:hypothetical protein